MTPRLAAAVLVGALVVILAIFTFALWKLSSSSDVATVAVASITGIGTLVTAFFGIHVAENASKRAEDRTTDLLRKQGLID